MNDTYGIRLILQQRNHNASNWNDFNLVELVALIARRELSFYCHHSLTHSPHRFFVRCNLPNTVHQTTDSDTDRQRRSPHVKISEKNNVVLWTVIRTDHEDHRIWKNSEKIVYVVICLCMCMRTNQLGIEEGATTRRGLVLVGNARGWSDHTSHCLGSSCIIIVLVPWS